MKSLGFGLLFLAACTGGTTSMDAGRPDLGGPDDAGPSDLGTVDLGHCDEDGDGALSMACGGNDCDDHSALRAPGHTEVCDVAGVDEDCNPATVGMRDDDTDGFLSMACCNADPPGAMHCGDDCNDMNAHVHPGAPELCDRLDNDCNGLIDDGASATEPEVCNGLDDNCNGMIDEGVTRTFFVDADGDGFGDSTAPTTMACTAPAGYVSAGTDCNDTVASVHPGAVELCDGIDNDCDGAVDPGCGCITGTVRSCGLPGACAAGTETCVSGAFGPCSIMPSTEFCNGIDDNCNGVVDEGVTITCYADADGDTYAATGAAATPQCPSSSRPTVGGCPVSYTNRPPVDATSTDCDDTMAAVHPGAGCP